MKFRSFNSILDECLAAIQQGETVDECLARYPAQAERLEPLLILVDKVRSTPPAQPRPWPQAAAWQRVHQRATDLRAEPRSVQLNLDYGAWLRPVAITLALLLALFGATGGTVLAAQNSLPDSPLYRVKLATEDVRLWFVFDDVHRAEILLDQSNERMDEILEMNRQDKAVPSNVLTALRSRNERATDILAEHRDETGLTTTLVQQAEAQEANLILLFNQISKTAYTPYTEALAATHNARLPGGQGAAGIHPEELSDGVQHISGVAEKVNENLWSVGGLEVRVDQTTIGQPIENGSAVSFVVGKNSRGQLRALTVSTSPTGLPPSGSVVSGQVEQVTDQGIVIGGQFIPITSQTFLTGKLKKGQKVEVKMGKSETGVVASTVRPVTTPAPAGDEQEPTSQFTFEGVIEGDVKKPTVEWKIGGLSFTITPDTAIDASAGQAKSGARVLVEATRQEEQLSAHKITVLASGSLAESAEIIGVFDKSRNGVWYVSGLQLVPPERTAEPLEGTLLFVDLIRRGADLEVKSYTRIEAPDDTGLVRLDVTISKLEGALWTVDFGTVRVSSTAEFSGPEAVVGARAIVWGRQNQNGVLEASFARILDKTAVVATPAPASPVPTTAPAGNAGP
jgi:hypothetical protein